VADVRLRAAWRTVACASLMIAVLNGFTNRAAHADAGWFQSGDTQLRLDLQLLNDAEVIRLPVNYWPLPRAAVQYALANAKEHFATNAAVAAALERVRGRATSPDEARLKIATGVSGGKPGLWRDFDTLAREDGELGMAAIYDSADFSVGLEVEGVTNPEDGDELRIDGSQATAQLGNWLVSANTLDRWWGPGHEGSLILSNNARPMPTIMAERAEARAFETKWLSWLGPWRMSFGLSQMEHERQDIDSPLFMAWRISATPTRKFEFGLSRTAQFCGQELPCGLHTFGNVLLGHDNVGRNVSKADEPGNEMAGYDVRWSSPIGNLPYAIYGQYIGEDVSSYLPAKYLSQLGLELWHPRSDGGLVQGFFEYASTSCTGKHGTVKACAYNQGLFNIEGYRYHGRSIGYTADRDAENSALGGIFAGADGHMWTATARFSQLSSQASGDFRNTVASRPTDYGALELGWKGRLLREPVSVDLGVQSTQPVGQTRSVEAFGFVSWHHDFAP